MLKINYSTEEERNQILIEYKQNGYILKEEANLLDEKYLMFDTNSQLQIAQGTTETLELIIMLNEIQRFEQAQSNTEMIELMMMLGGM